MPFAPGVLVAEVAPEIIVTIVIRVEETIIVIEIVVVTSLSS